MSAALAAAAPSERERLIAAFVLLVSARGYAALDPAEVCRTAGLDAEAFARNFDDRRHCFEAAWEGLEEAYLERLAAAYRGVEDWREQLRAGIGETLRLIEAHPAAARFMAIETFAAGDRERTYQRRLATRLAELLEASTRSAAALPSAWTPEAPRWILATVFDRIYRHLLAGTEQNLSAQLPELMFLALASVLGSEQALDEVGGPPG